MTNPNESVAINKRFNTELEQTLPWYRYGWPWFLISIPFVSVALGSVMLYLAFNANNSLVVDDYYKEGKGINLRIERDRSAALLGLRVHLSATAQEVIIEVDRQIPALPGGLQLDAARLDSEFSWPDTLKMKWVHVTQELRDGAASLQYIGGDRYVAANVQLPQEGKYRVHLEPDKEASWRLVSPLIGFNDDKSTSQLIAAPLPIEVFNRSAFE